VNEFRRDPVSDRWVIIAADRDARPNQYDGRTSKVAETGKSDCPFCRHQMDTVPPVAKYRMASGGQILRFESAEGDSGTAAIPAQGDPASDWQVCVVPNLYPILEITSPVNHASGKLPAEFAPPGKRSPADGDMEGGGLLDVCPAQGMHDVVIESPTHATSMKDLTEDQFHMMLFAYRDRMRTMYAHGDIRYVQVIKNRGHDAGASLHHSHSQIIGINFVPAQVRREINASETWQQTHGRCVLCDLLATELQQDQRIVDANEDFIAWCPYASRFGFETWIAPRQHASRFEQLDDRRLKTLSSLFQSVLRRLESHPRIEAYNYLLHSLPLPADGGEHYHWHFEILPRIAKEAGFEWGTQIGVNTVSPERAAVEIRQPQ